LANIVRHREMSCKSLKTGGWHWHTYEVEEFPLVYHLKGNNEREKSFEESLPLENFRIWLC
jgi:hypothetical protein